MRKIRGAFVAILASGLLVGVLAAAAASAQILVGYQQRFFEKYSNGAIVGRFEEGSTKGDSVPCCTAMGTFDQRTTGANMGAYFAEFKRRQRNWYGFYRPQTGGVTLKQGAFTTKASLGIRNPGPDVVWLSTKSTRTVKDLVLGPNNGPGTFDYDGADHIPGIPPFRTPMTWPGPYNQMAGHLHVTAGPNRFGGTRAILHESVAEIVYQVVPTLTGATRVRAPVLNGPGAPFTPLNVVRRRTAAFDVAFITLPSTMAVTGMVIIEIPGTRWFTILPYTTGTVQAIGTDFAAAIVEFTTRTDMGFNDLHVTGMGGITGQLQLVSGHLLQSRLLTTHRTLAGTNLTRITFTPEPASAAMLGAGALGLLGHVVRARRGRT